VATTASIRVVKNFHYRGTTRTFSNRYHFTGGTPADSAHWTTLSDAIVTAEKACFPSLANQGAQIIESVGYAAGSEVPVFTKTYATDGTLALGAVVPCTGDSAALVRYATAARSSKNHPIYLFNYYHACFVSSGAGSQDILWATQGTALGTYATAWITGFSDGTNTLKRASPNGSVATGMLVETMVTHRDLPR
jgi:hypothetical protein